MANDAPTLLCDVSTGQPRPIVPENWRRKLFDVIHGLSHPSIRTTRKLLTSKCVWHGLNKQLISWARACIPCQQSKISRHVRAPLARFEVPQRRFTHINLDLVGPLPASQEYTYLLTIVDRSTRWPEATPLSDISAQTCAKALVANWVARFGLPSDITSDRGAQFTSALWGRMAELLGTKLHHTTAYHPQANGTVGRFHRHLKSALSARLFTPHWIDELPWVLLSIRTAPKEDLNASSAELVYSTPLIVPGDFVARADTTWHPNDQLRSLWDFAQSFEPVPTSTHGTPPVSIPRNLHIAKFVFIRQDAQKNPFQRPYEGPFKVIKTGEKYFKIQKGNRQESVSIDRLKPAYQDLDLPIEVAQPPLRGRPPRQAQQSQLRPKQISDPTGRSSYGRVIRTITRYQGV